MSPTVGYTEMAKLGYITDAFSSFPVYTPISDCHMRNTSIQNLY